MRLVGRCCAFVLLIWTGAVGARSVVERWVVGHAPGRVVPLDSTPNVIDVGDRLWRGPAPGQDGYSELAEAGVSLVVDLRSEADLGRARIIAERSGLELLALPVDNARAPAAAHVELFADHYRAATGVTYIHCHAGEGRTGALIGAYRVGRGQSVRDSVTDALAVGSLTFSQLAYIASRGRLPLLAAALEWAVDRPTEMLFDMARSSNSSQHSSDR